MATNWPLHAEDLRKALEYSVGQDDAEELELFMAAACERIDRETGRHRDPERHEVNGRVPAEFLLWARALAKLRWRQEKKGPRARPDDGGDAVGFDLPRAVQEGLAQYPPRPGFGA
ncbi:hypothetical protein [Microbacterium sp. Bi128]|uniref:hypothetical protein n=1 Tax=Microbacterium sp. Bi128 TaxID=2821115 RepID=UPI001D3FD26D|nr:hypothetical protein [Microbacterium sp. Bi128]CAH0248434.1 hypothetical protein SRABI128_02854 [Microbacterium sp. Bi128]